MIVMKRASKFYVEPNPPPPPQRFYVEFQLFRRRSQYLPQEDVNLLVQNIQGKNAH